MNHEFEFHLMGQPLKKFYEKYYGGLMTACSLKKIDIDILYFLSSSQGYDTAKDIANLMFVSKSHISKSIEHLYQMGYIDLVTDKADRRYTHVHISPKGQPITQEITRIKAEVDAILFQGISTEEQQAVSALCRKIAENVHDELEKDG
jgi:DNA-binding MarR family transcriptional regulator